MSERKVVTVYVLLSLNVEDVNVVGVFSTEEKAGETERARKANNPSKIHYWVEPWDVDAQALTESRA